MAHPYTGLDAQAKQIIGGTVSHLKKGPAKLNLLSKMDNAMVDYDGEDVERFGLALGDQVVTGVFENASFVDGDDVKAVVSPNGDGTFHAHAVVRVSDGLLWMPYNVSHGTAAHRRSSLKTTLWGGAACLVLLLIVVAFVGGFSLMLLGMLAAGMVLIGAPISYSVYRAGLPEARYADSIFKLLGFKQPQDVDLAAYALAREIEFLGKRCGHVFRLRKALAAYGSLSKAPPAAKPAGAQP